MIIKIIKEIYNNWNLKREKLKLEIENLELEIKIKKRGQ